MIERGEVAGEACLEFFTGRKLPLWVETFLFATAARITEEAEDAFKYVGGGWKPYQLTNGGWYLAPDSERRFAVTNQGNQTQTEVSADAFGLIVTSHVCSHLSFDTRMKEEVREGLSGNYYMLRNYIYQDEGAHPESGQIYTALD